MIGMQANINKVPFENSPVITHPFDEEELLEQKQNQNNENINNQDYITEVLNISKVKEGFYIGDKIAAISIEVVVQFKLTHIINASGNNIMNQWESIGMKYLTLNWEESPNQALFDQKDEIADKILFFVDDSFINGEGIMAHSFKGQNRVCIVVLIYLMKKYKWSLKKSMEYLKSKKQDVDIPSYFLSQLIKFEARLIQRGELTKDIPWSNENLKDPEEKLLRNTYLNGINKNKINRSNLNENKGKIRHILWIDNLDTNQQIPISIINLDKDLFFKKNIRPIFVHKQIKPLKPCIKQNSKKFMVRQSSSKAMITENEGNNININNMLKNNTNIIISGNKIYKNFVKNEENNNKLINSIPLKNSNSINKKANNNNQNNNNQEINTNLEKNIEILKVPNRKGLNINKNYLRNSNKEENLNSNNKMKNSIKGNNNENVQLNSQQNKNNFCINSYNLSTSNSSKHYYNENTSSNLRFNKYEKNDNENKIEISKFSENEINNIKVYDEKGKNINNIINIKHKKKDHSYNRRDDKKENIIIIASKCDNIIKNNINNYYINQIGTINNNINNNQLTNNYSFKNNSFKSFNNNSFNNNKETKNSNKIIPIVNIKKKSIKRKNEIEDINIDELKDIKDLNNKTFNNTNKMSKNNIKNIIGNNHRQILGISNNNENNYFIIEQNEEISKNLESNISPKNKRGDRKIINLTNNVNGKKFKIIENTGLKNYKSNDNILNNKKRNHNINNMDINSILENNQKLNRNNHNFNIIITTKKGIKNTQTSPNHFSNQMTPKNLNLSSTSNKLDKYEDSIISNYNPIKKNNRNNRSIPNLKNKSYYGNDIENNYNLNINNYNISSNKPLNNFNPNLIKRKGTPTAGHQSIKINNINKNPIKLKNNILSNDFKKPSTPDNYINKSITMMRNNNYANTNNLFISNSSINLNKSAFIPYKLKKMKYNGLSRPCTAPHKDNKERYSKEKKRKHIIHHIHESKKGINNYNKNAIKSNLRPGCSIEKEKNNNLNNSIDNKEKNDYYSIKYINNDDSNIIHIGNKIEMELGNKYNNRLEKRRLCSPPVLSNNKINFGNNNIKYNFAKQRLPTPMIKSSNINGKNFNSNFSRCNTNYNNISKNNSFSLK